jgi:general secretion pathway protein C
MRWNHPLALKVMLSAIVFALAATAPPDLSAVGVVVARRPEASVAILRAGGRSRVVGLGETAFGGRVAEITSSGVVLDFEGTRTTLRLASAPAALAAAPAPPPLAAAADPGAMSMDRRELERRLSQETSRILAETALVPVQNGSQVEGFAITRMPEGTLLTDAGLKPGDIVTEINGTPIDSLATLIGLWPKLQNETSVRATVLRGGQPMTLSLSLR